MYVGIEGSALADGLGIMSGFNAEATAQAMAELVIAIAYNEAEMGIPTGTVYTALEEVYYAFNGHNSTTAKEALEARKEVRVACEEQGWELDIEEFDLN